MTKENWSKIIDPNSGGVKATLSGMFSYKDLVLILVKRDFKVTYSQTILGPLWFLLQPLLFAIVAYVVFGKLAKLPTNGVPPFLFYIVSISCWNLFSDVLVKSSTIFRDYHSLFSKVYFPRLSIPTSMVFNGLIKFCVQCCLVVSTIIIHTDPKTHFTIASFFLIPVSVIVLVIAAFSVGLIFSSLTAKYRDLAIMVPLISQVLMYLSPVIYPYSMIPEKYSHYALLNPLSVWMETIRGCIFQQPPIDAVYYVYSILIIIILFMIGLTLFSHTEQKAMDYT